MKETHANDWLRMGDNLLEVVAYGDAAGLPVEALDAQTIRRRYGRLDGLLPPSNHPFFAGEIKPGIWSDDTALSLAVSEALIAADGFDLTAQAETHLRAYYDTPKIPHARGQVVPRGWGGSTYGSIERLIAGVSPEKSGEEGGAGNGVIMKLAPLIFWQAVRGVPDEQRHAEYDALTTMTHDSPIARWASRLHGDFLYQLLTQEVPSEEYAALIRRFSLAHEQQLGLGDEGSRLLGYLALKPLAPVADTIRLHTDQKGFYVPQTLAMAYGIFTFSSPDFPSQVYGAVHLGGDTDSIASIVAAMLHFKLRGNQALPADAEWLDQRARLLSTSQALARAALGSGVDTSQIRG